MISVLSASFHSFEYGEAQASVTFFGSSALDVSATRHFRVAVVANGTMTMPFDMGHAVMGLSLDWNSDEVRFEARGDGAMFDTAANVVLGAHKKFKGGEKANVYLIGSLPNGVRISDMPGMKAIPDIQITPRLTVIDHNYH